MTKQKAFQDYFPGMTCFGCGPANRSGLKIKSFWSEDGLDVICSWRPKQIYSSGMENVLQGGIIATLIDCHSIWTAIAYDYREEQRTMGSEPMPGYVTGTFESIKLMRPTPMNSNILLKARVINKLGKKAIIHCEVFADNILCAYGQITAIRLPESRYIR